VWHRKVCPVVRRCYGDLRILRVCLHPKFDEAYGHLGPSTNHDHDIASLCSLLPLVSTTTWGSWNPNDTKATDAADPYGMAAWSSQWERAQLPNFTFTGIYSTTVSPTPVPTSELILPPADPFGPTDCYNFPEDFVLGVAGAAAQVEGAAATEGKGPSWADRFIGPEFVLEMFGQEPWERDHGYSSIENYYLYKQDI
jgi:hypothetical protein